MYPNLLMKRASLTPDRVALRFNEQEWTFAELAEEAIEFAEKLHTKGIERGMRIAILASSNPKLVVVLHGCMQLGCELVMLNERLIRRRVELSISR